MGPQSKLESFIEAAVNTLIGFIVTSMALPIINAVCGIKMSLSQMGLSTLLFTIISVLRSYVIRRFFNNLSTIKKWTVNLINKIL